MLVAPVIGFAPRFYRWLYLHRINQLHRALGNLESELAHGAGGSRLGEYQARLAEIESAVRMFKLRGHSKSIYTVLGFICAWFKKRLVEWQR